MRVPVSIWESKMAKLIAVRYIGRKPSAHDNVARSGKIWNGAGDIQYVTDVQARLLIKHELEWELVDQSDRKQVESPISLAVEDEDGFTVTVSPDSFKKPLERMSKSELKAFAKDKWNKDLDIRKSTKALIDQVEEWAHELDVSVGRVE